LAVNITSTQYELVADSGLSTIRKGGPCYKTRKESWQVGSIPFWSCS